MSNWLKKISYVLSILIGNCLGAQSEYTCNLAYGLNTEHDDMVTGMMGPNVVLITSNGVQDLINDYAWNKNKLFHMSSAFMRNDFADWNAPQPLWYKHINKDEGPGSYSVKDSTLYFCSTVNYGKAKGGFIKLYAIKKQPKGWSDPELLPFCDNKADYAHPYFDESQGMLVFSSNRQGGQGGLDIWLTYLRDGVWTEPLNLGNGVNTTSNEVFPSVYKEDIYYASNQPGGMGGFDLYKSLRKFQWQSSTAMPVPFNSVSDDMTLVFVSSDKCLITSNRPGGIGGDDIYVLQSPKTPVEEHRLVARVLFQKEAIEGATLVFKNVSGEIVHTTLSKTQGLLSIEPIRMNQPYKVQLSGVERSKWPNCVLQIEDQNGNIIRVFRFNQDGMLEMELLPFQHKEVALWEFEDTSLLTIDLEGQLYEETPGDVGQGEPIMILDENGTPVAIAYTNANGKFKFTDMEPQLSYNFVLAEESKARQILLTDKGQKIVLPVLKAEATYHRVNPDEAIALRNEFDQLIYVSPKDIFVINRIYYGYKSSELTPEAQRQLNQLHVLMSKNPDFSVDLYSHTDSRGSEVYNQRLSNIRAQSAIDYLIGKGINRNRLAAHGMGETQLIVDCGDESTCTEPEHSINRRTEIRLRKSVQ
jgi:outer membrane protein OmpA-like peptidoglycan-associated protein